MFAHTSSASANVTCGVTSGALPNGAVTVLRMAYITNSHASLPDASAYPNLIYCEGVSGLSNVCSGNYKVIAKLSSATNAHVRENGFEDANSANYPDANNACVSAPGGDTITVGYQDANCDGYDTTIASMTNTSTNSHIGGANDYNRKICLKIIVPPASGSSGFIPKAIEAVASLFTGSSDRVETKTVASDNNPNVFVREKSAPVVNDNADQSTENNVEPVLNEPNLNIDRGTTTTIDPSSQGASVINSGGGPLGGALPKG